MANQTYYATVLNSAPAANKVHYALWNGTAAQVLRIGLIQASGAPAAAVTGMVVPLYAKRITSAPTGGTAVVLSKARTNNTNVPGTIVSVTAPTGGAAEEATSPFAIGTVSAEETASLCESVLYEYSLNGQQAFTLDPGEGLIVRQNAMASTAGAINVLVSVTVAAA
jgi:hypothetical protein